MSDNNTLLHKKCVPCEGGDPPLTKAQIEALKPQLTTPWFVVEDKKLKKEFSFKDFMSAIRFVDKVAELAEAEGHHPDIYIFYNHVKIELYTHAVDGLSENDFILARKIETLV